MMSEDKKILVNHYADGTSSVLRKSVVYTELRFYQRSDVLYQLTRMFCISISQFLLKPLCFMRWR